MHRSVKKKACFLPSERRGKMATPSARPPPGPGTAAQRVRGHEPAPLPAGSSEPANPVRAPAEGTRAITAAGNGRPRRRLREAGAPHGAAPGKDGVASAAAGRAGPGAALPAPLAAAAGARGPEAGHQLAGAVR